MKTRIARARWTLVVLSLFMFLGCGEAVLLEKGYTALVGFNRDFQGFYMMNRLNCKR